MKRLQGIGAAPGVVRAPWVRIEPAPALAGGRSHKGRGIGRGRGWRSPKADAAVDLEAISRGSATTVTPTRRRSSRRRQRSPAIRPSASMAIERIHGSHDDAIGAIQAAAGVFAEQLRSLDDELLAARAADVIDVGDRIARRLSRGSTTRGRSLDRPAIVVADDLPPSLTATLPRERLLGIALEGSSPTAHAAILARAYGIPAVVGVRDLLETLRAEVEPVDEPSWRSMAAPARSSSTRTRRPRARFDAGADCRAAAARSGPASKPRLPAVTLDGIEITLLANIGTPDESDAAIALGAQGVGLFRTEFLFLERTSPPSEDEQFAAYERVVRAFAPHPVTIRLLDVGGDKPIPYLPIGHEANPFLGVRALRLAFADPSLFVTQLRACYRAAAAGPLKVMAPMVADAGDVDLLLSLAERARNELAAKASAIGEVALGVMLEIPSAILVADSYFGRISFASLGTNDLLQYTLAVDRGNASLERYRDALHPSVLRLVRLAVEAAERAGIELSVCGEMAGDPAAAVALAGLGSGPSAWLASSLPAVRRAIRGVRLADLESAATLALDEPSAAAVRTRFEGLLMAGSPS